MSKDLAGAVDLLCFFMFVDLVCNTTYYTYMNKLPYIKSALIASLYISLLNLFLERILRNDLKEWFFFIFSEAVFLKFKFMEIMLPSRTSTQDETIQQH